MWIKVTKREMLSSLWNTKIKPDKALSRQERGICDTRPL